jgi:hypothetical protein
MGSPHPGRRVRLRPARPRRGQHRPARVLERGRRRRPLGDGPQGVTAAEVAPGTSADRVGIRPGDILLAIDGRPVERPGDVLDLLHAGDEGTRLSYTLLRLGDARVLDVPLAPIPRGNTALYYVLAAVGMFSLLVGAFVRLRRPGDEATLHFFWLCVAFFGTFTFSFSGKLDRLDWVFYWADAVSILLLPPLFLHFTLVFPERPRSWVRTPAGAALLPLLYVPAALLGLARVIAVARAPLDGPAFARVMLEALDRFEPLYLAVCFAAGSSCSCAPSPTCARSPRAGSCAGSRGARASAPCRSRSATRCPTRSASRRRCRWSSRRCRSASCRSPSPPPSSATG